jgi:hypothetical protein
MALPGSALHAMVEIGSCSFHEGLEGPDVGPKRPNVGLEGRSVGEAVEQAVRRAERAGLGECHTWSDQHVGFLMFREVRVGHPDDDNDMPVWLTWAVGVLFMVRESETMHTGSDQYGAHYVGGHPLVHLAALLVCEEDGDQPRALKVIPKFASYVASRVICPWDFLLSPWYKVFRPKQTCWVLIWSCTEYIVVTANT